MPAKSDNVATSVALAAERARQPVCERVRACACRGSPRVCASGVFAGMRRCPYVGLGVSASLRPLRVAARACLRVLGSKRLCRYASFYVYVCFRASVRP